MTIHPPVSLADLARRSGVGFGTSGARGRAADLTDAVCYAYTAAFLQHLDALGEGASAGVALGGDLRPSTGPILGAIAQAVVDRGLAPLFCGRLPSPALALFGRERGIPTVMVTGSHIPDDRNGIKFTRARGEITKGDEEALLAQVVELRAGAFDAEGRLRSSPELPPPDPAAAEAYVARFLRGFPPGCLKGLRVGLYEHSAVGRDLLARILEGLGAAVTRLGRSAAFLPVDTEAIRPEDEALAREWAASGDFDALVSADGDSDRPLVADEAGCWLRGDVAGILTAQFLGAETVVLPVSCNTAAEGCGAFRQVRRTRIGSPYVIAGMEEALAQGARAVVGYEANGGFLTASPFRVGAESLPPLPTRDAAVVIVAILAGAARRGVPVSRLAAELPPRFTASDRLQDFPGDASRRLLASLGGATDPRRELAALFRGDLGPVVAVDETDGLRGTFASGEIVHLRPSGNAPEFRCYAEATSPERARTLVALALDAVARWRAGLTDG